MSIDPVSFALFAEAAAADPVPLATIECTPTPSRAQSPLHLGGDDGDDLHGAEAFIAHAVREGRFAGGVRVPEEGEGEGDSGAETETEHDSDRAAGWTRYSLAAPNRPSSLAQNKNKAPPPPTRSRSTSELANLFDSSASSSVATTTITNTMGTFSPVTGSGLTARVHSPPPTTTPLHRRSSSFSGPHHFHHHPHHHEEDGRGFSQLPLSHEERIMLGGERPSSSSAGSAAPWGGDVDSFELALNYWKRMWRRLRGTTTMGGGGAATTPIAPAAAATVAPSSSDDGNEVRSAAESSSSSSARMRRKQQKTVDLLVPEARVGRV